MYTNESIYNNLMTILRKEKEGKTISEEQFNQLLKLASEEILNQEYEKYEVSQRETDSIKALKVEEEIELDYLGEYDLDGLTYDYWHPSYINYTYNGSPVEVDVVTDGEWNKRLSSDMMYPTVSFPIAKLINDKLKCFPINREHSSTNLVTNSGYTGTTDWVDTDDNGVADDWSTTAPVLPYAEILDSEYNFSGRAQSFTFGTDTVRLFSSDDTIIRKNNWYYIEFYYYITSGIETLSYFTITDGSNTLLSIDPIYDYKTKFSGIFYYYGGAGDTVAVDIFLELSALNSNRRFIIDGVFVSSLSEATKLNFGYLKKPSDPYFDYYVDANDQIKYLTEGASYTLKTNETYTDKDDGTARTSGYVITSGENKTVELWLPESERPKILYNILQKLSVSLSKQDAFQYGIAKEQA